MKKFLLTGVLTLTIIASMVAGTLATYSKTLDPIGAEVYAKIFDIEANQTTSSDVDIKIAPTETVDWEFAIRNYENKSTPTEVGMDLLITVKYPKALAEQGLEVELQLDNHVPASGPELVLTGDDMTSYIYSYDEAFHANVAEELAGTLSFHWNAGIGSDSVDVEGLGGQFSVTITGQQELN